MKPTCTFAAAKRFYQLADWRGLRRRIFERDGWRCRTCGRAGRLECDHIKNWRDGGAFWEENNLQTLCRGCHIEKTRREVAARRQTWEERLEGL